MIYLYSLLTGLSTGLLFALLKLPIPAPPAFAGVLGIIGIWVGFAIVNYFIK
jgi:XapX domain-containing protein